MSRSPSTLFPGFKHVDNFRPDQEYEEEEVSYVTLDLGNIEPTLIPTSTAYRLIGLDTQTPFLQLYGNVFKGQHVSLLGTELLFTEEKDVNDRSRRHISPVAGTERRIRFKEVQLKPKKDAEDLATTNPGGKEKEKEKRKRKDDTERLLSSRNIDVADRMTGSSGSTARFTGEPKSRSRRKGKQRESDVQKDETVMDSVVENDDGQDEAMDLTRG